MKSTYREVKSLKTDNPLPGDVQELVKEKDLRLHSYHSLLTDTHLKLQGLQSEVNSLKEKLSAYESPADGYRKDATWVGKIVFILQKAGRPLQSKELIELLERREPLLHNHQDKQKFFSALLTMAVKHKRVQREKRKGERGYFYYL